MKTFQKFSLLLACALTFFDLRAAANDVATFSGTVVDAHGKPVAGATVDCYQYPSRLFFGKMEMEAKQHTTTDRRGAFKFPTFQGMGIVLVRKAGFAPNWQMWRAAPQEPQKIVLGASFVLAGKVVDDEGRPVADAEVWVPFAFNKTMTDFGQPNTLFGKISRELFSTRTSADGKFRIENFPAGAQAALSVKKTGWALHQPANSVQYNQLPFHAGQEDITLTLEPAGSVTGKIVTRGTGQPLAGVVVGLRPSALGMGYYSLLGGETVASAADGSFQIPDVPAGSYLIMANFTNKPAADWVADTVPINVAAGQAVPDVRIQAYKGGIVKVTVLGKNRHEPLADVNVSVNSGDYNNSGLTGTNGMVSFRLPPGQFSVFAIKPDWSQAQEWATVKKGQTIEVKIELSAPLKISGVVRDASGVPVAGASVGVFPNYSSLETGARTDANGHYELNWQKPSWGGPANRSMYLLARDPERKLAAMKEMDETTTNLDVTLQPAMSVSGRVQDTKGKAVTNAVAYISIHRENSSFTLGRQPVHTDGQGRLQADALPRGERYGWYVSARDYGSAHQEMDAADPNADHYDFPPLVLKIADRKLAGRVLGTNGQPVVGAQIWMNGEGQPNDRAISGADGRFVFDAVCKGAVSLFANFKGINGQTEDMGGNTNVVIRLNARNRYFAPSSQTLTGTVYDPSGNPAVGARVVVTPSWGRVDVAKTDDKGEYSVNWQSQPGMRNVRYFAIARDLDRNLAAIEAIDTNKTHVDLRLRPGLSISGTVQDTKGAPLTHANINLNIQAGRMGGMVEYQAIKINSDGTFTIPALPMGQKYNVYVTESGYGSAFKNIRKTQSQAKSIRLSPFKLRVADRTLAGQVLGTDGKPLFGVQVNISGNGQPNGNMRTDATGHFKFKVCDGPIQVFAFSSSGSGRNNFGNVRARGGDTHVVVKMGVHERRRRIVKRQPPLKPQQWTLSALVAWPVYHKTGTIILLSLQAAVLLGAGGWVFWFTRKRK